MSFFDDLSKQLSKTGQEALKKTKDFADTTKLQSQISDCEAKIDGLFLSLGQNYYMKYKDICDSEFEGIITRIAEYYVKIEEYKKEIMFIKGAKNCPDCGETLKMDDVFCFKCGRKLISENTESMQKEKDEDVVKCSKCGFILSPNSVFCTECGTEVKDQTQGG